MAAKASMDYRGSFRDRSGVRPTRPSSDPSISPPGPVAGGTSPSSATLSRLREVKGVGYRVRRSPVVLPEGKTRVIFDVGASHRLTYDLPHWVRATVDPTFTKRTLTANPLRAPSRPHEAMGNLVHQLAQLRPRSDYTGNGILQTGKVYRPLKSTKTSKK